MQQRLYTTLLKNSKALKSCENFDLEVELLSDHSTQRLAQLIVGQAFIDGVKTKIYEGQFNSYRQEILDPQSEFNLRSSKIVILSLSQQRVSEENITFDSIRSLLNKIVDSGRSLIINNLPNPVENEFGNLSSLVGRSRRGKVETFNQKLREFVKTDNRIHLVDLNHVASFLGLANFLRS